MGDLDEVSAAIGRLQGKVGSIEQTQKAIFGKLETIHAEQMTNKINTTVEITKLSGKVGLVTAVVTYGLAEGLKLYFKSHGGQ